MAESATRIAFTRMKNWQETMHSCNPLSVFLISSHGYQPHRLLLITQQPCKSCMEWKHFPITGETCMKHGVAFIVKERRCILPVRLALTVTAQKKKNRKLPFSTFFDSISVFNIAGSNEICHQVAYGITGKSQLLTGFFATLVYTFL